MSVSCRILAIIVLPIKSARMLASVMQVNPAPGPTITSWTSVLGLLKII